MKNFCEWCHGDTNDDKNGNCMACGGNRNVTKRDVVPFGLWIKDIEESHSRYFGELIDEYVTTDIHGTIHLQRQPTDKNKITIIFEKLHKDKHEREYIFDLEKKTIQTWYRNEKVRVKYLASESL